MLLTLNPKKNTLAQQESPEREIIPEEKLTSRGTHTKSTITLCTCKYNCLEQTSAFIHPTDYELNEVRVIGIDNNFKDIRIIKSRSFNRASLEDVEFVFLNAANPMISFMSHSYNSHRPPIKEHSFEKGSEAYLEGIIDDLKV